MKRLLLAGLAAAPLLLTPVRSDAVIVECSNCSDMVDQLASNVKQALQYAKQLQEYQTQLQQYANMLQNTAALPQSIWSNVTADINQVRSLTNAASLLTGNSGAILTRLQTPGAYADQASMTPQQIGQQFGMWQTTLGNASNSLARTLGVQQGQEQNYAALQAAMQVHSQTAVGQMQAIQAGNELAGLANTQLQQIQTTLTVYAQDQTNRGLVADDRQAAHDAADLQFFQYQPIATTGSQGF